MAQSLHRELDALRERLVIVEASVRTSATAIDAVRGDSARIMLHLGELQADHDRVKITGWSHEESVQRLKALWSDVQRDMTSLAEALARLDRD